MTDTERSRYFSSKAAIIGAIAASIIALPLTILDVYHSFGPPGKPFTTATYRTIQQSPIPLPPLLTGLIELEYQRKGVDGVADLMKQVDGAIYKDIVYAYLITMLLGQNTDIRGVSTYEPTPFGTHPSNYIPLDPPPAVAPTTSINHLDSNGLPTPHHSGGHPRTLLASFEQSTKDSGSSAVTPAPSKTDKAKIVRAATLAQSITEPDYRIFMLVEIGKANAAIDKNAVFDASTVRDGITILNQARKHLIGYHPSPADSIELARQLEHTYASLEASRYSPAAIRKSLRTTAEHYLDEFIELKVPYPAFDPTMRQLSHADSIVEEALSKAHVIADEDRKANATRSEATWAAFRTLLLAGLSAVFCGFFTPFVTASGWWFLRKSAVVSRSEIFQQETENVLKAKAESGSKKADHESGSSKE